MSYTTLYAAFEDGTFETFGYVQNAWRGAVAIWNWLNSTYMGTEFNMFDENAPLFKLAQSARLPAEHRLLLQSTCDWAVCGPDHAEALADALESFPASTENHKKQAEMIRAAFALGARAVAWRATSCGDTLWREYDPETDGSILYNIDTGTSHWWLTTEVEK